MKSTYKIKKENLKLTTLGFTLIELIAVLVIMAILALIVTPLVLNIIRKARTAADKRSIDAYGRSIEIAIAGYLLDNGTFPTSIGQLTIEYSGDEVVCSTTQLNGDSSVYLTGCTVGGRSVDYTYGSDKTPVAPTYTAYSIGDEVRYNNIDYYVIANSGANESTVTLLKAEPLTTEEVNTYGGVGTANNHVNMYSCQGDSSCHQIAEDWRGYGQMSYYSHENCDTSRTDGCESGYAASDVKYVVDVWAQNQAPAAIEARLITKKEIDDNFELEDYEYKPCGEGCGLVIPQKRLKDNWMYNNDYPYWTMTEVTDSQVYTIGEDGGIADGSFIYNYFYVVRPVITLSKSAL